MHYSLNHESSSFDDTMTTTVQAIDNGIMSEPILQDSLSFDIGDDDSLSYSSLQDIDQLLDDFEDGLSKDSAQNSSSTTTAMLETFKSPSLEELCPTILEEDISDTTRADDMVSTSTGRTRLVSPCRDEGDIAKRQHHQSLPNSPKLSSKHITRTGCGTKLDFSIRELPTPVPERNAHGAVWIGDSNYAEDLLLLDHVGSFSPADVLPSYSVTNNSTTQVLFPSMKVDSKGMMNLDGYLNLNGGYPYHQQRRNNNRTGNGHHRYYQNLSNQGSRYGESSSFPSNNDLGGFNNHGHRRVVQTPYGPAVLMSSDEEMKYITPNRSSRGSFSPASQKSIYSPSSPPLHWDPAAELDKFERWSPKEDAVLRYAIEREGNQPPFNWKKIATNYFSNKRSGLQCKNRWLTCLQGTSDDQQQQNIIRPHSHSLLKRQDVTKRSRMQTQHQKQQQQQQLQEPNNGQTIQGNDGPSNPEGSIHGTS